MEYKDYYKILGVDRKATGAEIKRIYRKLAKQYHPDHNPNNPQAEAKFKEINEAYQVLSDSDKRARYDQIGDSYANWQQGGGRGGFNWDDWAPSSPGGGARVDIDDLNDLFGGAAGGGFSEFFRRIFSDYYASGARPGSVGGAASPTRRSQGSPEPAYEQPVSISLLEAYQGATRRLQVNERQLEVKIPPGAKTGTKVRVANAIQSSGGTSTRSRDLYLVIEVMGDPRFERKGDDLHTKVNIDLFTAVLGGEAAVPTLTGEVLLTIPAGTQPDQVFRLGGRGMPHTRNPQVHGDLFARVQVKLPRNLTPQQRELFEKLRQT